MWQSALGTRRAASLPSDGEVAALHRRVIQHHELRPRRSSRGDLADVGAPELTRAGDYWNVAFEGRTFNIRDLKGLHYLARLLAEPGRDFHVLQLVVEENRGNAAPDVTEPETPASGTLDAGSMPVRSGR